ncbi:MAG: hypothetical protein JO328_12980 [Hyphomicrobiales bacterium]|nr:hypothetical protein [Hyphomicrobiales bacterium]MBV8826163.1 hypothetical protein [Hyphomicrobiales bacterium]
MNNTAVVTTETNPHHQPPPVPAASVPAASAVAAPAMTDVFGKPALLRDEDANLYDALFSRVVAAARPRDPFEWMLLKDYADLAWEIFRLRRAKAGFVNTMHKNALVEVLKKLALEPRPALLFHKNQEAKAAILEQLALHGLDEGVVTAEAVVACCDELALLDAMIKSAEQRRNAMLREIDYHRGGLATRLRDAPDVVDAESEDAPVADGAEAQPARLSANRR